MFFTEYCNYSATTRTAPAVAVAPKFERFRFTSHHTPGETGMGINELPGTKYEIARRNRPSCLVSPFSLSRGSDPIPGDDFVRHHIFWDVFLGDISFYLVLEFVSSFSSRSYPPVRKCTDRCGMNMSTNMALKTRTWCYSFDQSLGNVMEV